MSYASRLDSPKTPPSPDRILSATNSFSSLDVAMATSPSDKTVFARDNSLWERTILRKSSRLFTAVIIFVMAVLSVVPAISAAQPFVKKGGMTISPAFQELIINRGDNVLSAEFSVSNNDTTPANFRLSAIDMGTLDETGGVAFTGLSADYQTKYGLAKWIKLAQREITVLPKTSANIKFKIVDDGTLSPGGHYGAIVVKRQGAQATASNQITLSPEAASLLFVKKIDGARYAMELDSLQIDGAVWRLPQQVKLNFSNSGNVHVVPRGTVTIKDRMGRVVSRGVINDNSSMILPEHTRQVITRLSPLSRAYLPGRYKVELTYRYDGQDSPKIMNTYVYWLNLPMLSVIMVALVGLCYCSYRLWRIRQKRRVTKPKPQPPTKTKKPQSIKIIYKP